MEQQHSAHAGSKRPGQAQGQGHHPARGQKQGDRARRRGQAADAAAAGPAAVQAPAPAASADSPVPAGPSAAAAEGSTAQRARRRGGGDAIGREAAALYYAQLRFPLIPARLTEALSWLPRARLTALGSGLLAVLLMLIAGGACRLLFDNSAGYYGGAFLMTCVVCACWVRPADLWTAPVAVPLAYTAGLLLISGGPGTQGVLGHLTSLFPALAVNAPWLYAGTGLAAFVALLRKIGLIVQRSRLRALVKAREEAEADEVP